MKPFVLFLGLTISLFGGVQTALAQARSIDSAQLPTADSVRPATVHSVESFTIDSAQPPGVDPWWNSHMDAWPVASKLTAPAPLSDLPHGYLWQDYRGVAVEHDIHLLHAHASLRHFDPPRGLLSMLGCWFDKLRNTRPLPHKQAWCASCGTTFGTQPPQFTVEPIPEVRLQPAREPSIPKPVPDLTLEDSTPGHSVPKAELKAPAILTVPEQVNPLRPPVVELAPDFVPPSEPARPVPPRNRIPVPGSLPPRNIIPR